jgi:K+-sensing histidine kinase KdpD
MLNFFLTFWKNSGLIALYLPGKYRFQLVFVLKYRADKVAKEKVVQLESKKAEVKKKNAVKEARVEAIRETAVTLNHKINTPLSTIMLKTELLLRTKKGLDEDMKKGLLMIQDEVGRIYETIGRLRSVYNAESVEYLKGIKMIDIEKSTVSGKA